MKKELLFNYANMGDRGTNFVVNKSKYTSKEAFELLINQLEKWCGKLDFIRTMRVYSSPIRTVYVSKLDDITWFESPKNVRTSYPMIECWLIDWEFLDLS